MQKAKGKGMDDFFLNFVPFVVKKKFS